MTFALGICFSWAEGYRFIWASLLVFLSLLNCAAQDLPDLTIVSNIADPHVVTRTLTTNDCEVVEGCAQAGTRRLLVFTTETANLGASDVIFGDPATNPLFHYAPCHHHYHFQNFMAYRLLDDNLDVVALGNKGAFCLEDVAQVLPDSSPDRRYSCDYQGIQAGWADVYPADLPCQYIDITDVPAGEYFLEMEVDPDNLIAESDENNNIALVDVTIPADCSSLPTNDNFANAQALTANPGTVTAFNACASKEDGEPDHAGNPGGHSLWFRWTATNAGSIRISTEGSDFDTLLAVYSGADLAHLSLIASNDDILTPNNPQSRLAFQASVGVTYFIAVDGFNGAVGRIALNLNPPRNDDFVNCAVLAGLTGTVAGYNVAGSKEPGEPSHAGNIGGHSVWYCWTAPFDGPVEFDTIGSSFDTTLAAYRGEDISDLTEDASDNDSASNRLSRVYFNALAGTTYHLVVDGFSGATGNIVLHWDQTVRLTVERKPSNEIALSLAAAPGRYEIWAADDLQYFALLTAVTVTNSPAQATDPDGIAHAQRFYRAFWAP